MKYIAKFNQRIQNFGLVMAITLTSTLLNSCFTQESNPASSGGGAVSEDAPVKWLSSSLAGGMNVKIAPEIISDFDLSDDDSDGLNPVEQMYKQWNNSTTAETFFKIPAAQAPANLNHADLSSYRDSELGIYKSHSWFSNVQSSVLAVTQYYGYRRNAGTASEYIQITHADIIMNYRDYNFSTNSASTTNYDFHSVILHELGHFLGLGHTSSYSIDSVMQPSLGITSSKREVTSYDKASIVELYGGSSALMAQTNSLSVSRSMASVETTKVLPKAVRQISDDGEIHGLIELSADGICRHKVNGKVISVHKAELH